ncbi:RNA polymerase factor sigma-54 [Celeribacter indicus]|uniref:RNA polymerase sigma-54 factor n=1 Tax=Celeribacter indicus TaxID=1208324 RepID=A0A0B5E0Q0_9RHOB|nr:RNA polymerase factor sigma-54 [Celeribacter indicus]AJE49213.1 RNA polymerase factor sigma-54 [Celeribacter indicus]SDX51741.1 RNA polymerase, sigma 54 subunit, RpoN/SigL [Celeribacter indicus]
MELRPNLFSQQKQTISITSQVIQSIKLLHFGQNELRDFLREQAERNPLIEVTLGREFTVDPAPEPAREEAARPVREAENDGYARKSYLSGTGGGVAFGAEKRSLEEYCPVGTTLREALHGQVALSIADPQDQFIAREIVESLDPDGYFRRDPEEIANILGVGEARVTEVLGMVQTFEPTGVGARDLAECLRLQLVERGQDDPAMLTLVDNLDLLANFDIARLARLCGLSQDGVMELARKIRELDPRPGRCFDTDPVLPALPDVQVEMHEDGRISVELNTSLMPRVLVDREYYAEIRQASRGVEDARFVTDCMRNANWLVRNVDQRAQTILRVATEIVTRQRAFFEQGLEHLKPLYLRDVAEAVGLHESTVCRATTDKYMMTPRGMFELKFFFMNSLGSTDGSEELSAETVRQKIRHMIEAETAATVLSDSAIMAALQAEGIDIARRTVAKYREMLHIPTSQKRKRMKRAQAIGTEAVCA